MAASLKTQLRSYGCESEPWQFRERLADLMFNLYPGWTDERLTLNPDEAKRYCHEARASFGMDFPDEFILGTLCNIRRHSLKV